MTAAAIAYPPDPDHLLYGQVRDEFGNPLSRSNAEVILETNAGIQVKTALTQASESGVNYRLAVPMDAGLTSDRYKATALHPAVPFKLKIRIGTTDFLPIEMMGDFAQLGRPGRRTRLDLTLGADSDGDGLPDAWELALLALAANQDLGAIHPDDDSDGDGLSNLEEYIAGTYAFDPEDAFELKAAGFEGSSAILEFTAIKGRTYTLLGSTDAQEWLPAAFRVSGVNAEPAVEFFATDVRPVKIEVPSAGQDAPSHRFFKLKVR